MDVGDQVSVKAKKTRAKLNQEQEREELRKVLENAGARWFIWRLLAQCGVFRTLSAADPHTMAILSGKRDAGLWVLEQLFDADPKVFQMMQSEAREREKNV